MDDYFRHVSKMYESLLQMYNYNLRRIYERGLDYDERVYLPWLTRWGELAFYDMIVQGMISRGSFLYANNLRVQRNVDHVVDLYGVHCLIFI